MAEIPIITVTNETEAPPIEEEAYAFYPGFQEIKSAHFTLMSLCWKRTLANSLAYRIRQKPYDLSAHIQRIELLYEQKGDNNELIGALQDMIRVLRGKGDALIERVLHKLQDYLTPDQYLALRAWHETLQNSDTLSPPAAAGGVMEENLPIVSRVQPIEDGEIDPLLEAEQYLDGGQVEEAQQVLENALLITPLRTDLNESLFNIYRRSQDLGAYERMRSQLIKLEPNLKKLWVDSYRFFNEYSPESLANQNRMDSSEYM